MPEKKSTKARKPRSNHPWKAYGKSVQNQPVQIWYDEEALNYLSNIFLPEGNASISRRIRNGRLGGKLDFWDHD